MARWRAVLDKSSGDPYLVGVHGDLLAGWSVLREWGRIGCRGRVRVEPFTELAAAEAAGARIERAKRWRGYA